MPKRYFFKRRQNKLRLILDFGGKCSKCGYDKCLGALHFHHREREGKYCKVGALLWKSVYEDIAKEAGKCDLLCGNCHYEEHERIRSRCGDYKRDIRKNFIIDVFGGRCWKCGYDKGSDALVFHHRIPQDKVFALAPGGWRREWEEILEEVIKCDLLCHNCHVEIHDEEKRGIIWLSPWVMGGDYVRGFEDPYKRFISDGWRSRLLASRDRIGGPYKDKEKENKTQRWGNERTCEKCGKVYKPTGCMQKYCSVRCANGKIEWPDNLVELVDKSNMTQVAKSLGVSDGAIRKRLLRYHLEELG